MALVFRPAEPRDRPGVLGLFHLAFREVPDPAEWDWKYDRNPRSAVSVVADDGGRIVGFFGAMATRYRGDAGDVPGALTSDIMTDPSARVLGKSALFQGLGNAYAEANGAAGVPFDVGFPHARSGKVGERLLGYARVEPCLEVGRPLDAPPAPGRPFARLFRRLREGTDFGGPWADYAEALHARPGWRSDRSADLMVWRLSRPGRDYRVFRLVDLVGRCRGHAVTTLRDGRALLVDLQVADEGSSDLPELVGAVHEALRGSPAARLVLRSSRQSALAARLVEELGFLEEPSDTALHVRAFAPGLDPFEAGRRFDYRFLDHDVF